MTGNILSLLGLALRGGRLAVGEEPTALAAKAGQARLILLAADAAGNTLRRAEHLAQEGHCLWLTTPFSKAELGGALGRGSAAIAALTDTGLAAAVTERLAVLDPERYAGAAARMDLKRRRAKERQSAPHRDPPKKAPPRQENRRPPKAWREAENQSRVSPSKDRRNAEDRRGGEYRPRPGGKGRSPESRLGRSQGGGPGKRRPGGGRPGEGRPRDGRRPDFKKRRPPAGGSGSGGDRGGGR